MYVVVDRPYCREDRLICLNTISGIQLILVTEGRYPIENTSLQSLKKPKWYQLLLHRRPQKLVRYYTRCPRLCPFGKHAFVQRQANGVHLVNWGIEIGLEISMCAKGLENVACSSIFGIQLDRFEIPHIVCIR